MLVLREDQANTTAVKVYFRSFKVPVFELVGMLIEKLHEEENAVHPIL